MNANGSGRRRLFVRCCGTGVLPIWSPDGKHIAFSVASAKPQDSGIYLMDTNGSHLHRVRAGNWAELAWQPIP